MNDKKNDIITRLASSNFEDNLAVSMFNNKFEMWMFIISGLSFLIFIFLFFIQKNLSYWFFISGLVTILLYSFAYFIKNISSIFKPTKSYFEDLNKRIFREDTVLKELLSFKLDELCSSKERLILEKEFLTKRFGFLLGAMDKLGLIPAIVAVYLSYAKAFEDPNLGKIPDILLMFLAGVYIGAFIVRHLEERISLMVMLIERAENILSFRETLQKQ